MYTYYVYKFAVCNYVILLDLKIEIGHLGAHGAHRKYAIVHCNPLPVLTPHICLLLCCLSVDFDLVKFLCIAIGP